MSTPLDDLKARLAAKKAAGSAPPAAPAAPAVPATPVAGTPVPTEWDLLNERARAAMAEAKSLKDSQGREDCNRIVAAYKLEEPLDSLSPPDRTRHFELGIEELSTTVAIYSLSQPAKDPSSAPATSPLAIPVSAARVRVTPAFSVWQVASLGVAVLILCALLLFGFGVITLPTFSSSSSASQPSTTKTEDPRAKAIREEQEAIQQQLQNLNKKKEGS